MDAHYYGSIFAGENNTRGWCWMVARGIRDYETYNFEKRGTVTDEYIEIFKRLSEGGEVSFKGQAYMNFPEFIRCPDSPTISSANSYRSGIANPH